MSCCRFSMNSVPSGGVCFIPVIFFAAFVSPLYSSLFLLFSPLSCLSASTHSHALSLGYYQDKSIWSIQGSGCHFIHIFSSLVTLLKATASIYPEWMNARADETRREMRPTQPEMTTANQPVISQRVLQFLGFTCNPKQPGDAEAFGTMFPIHLWVKRHRTARPPALQWQEKGCWDFRLGGGGVRRYSQRRHRAEKVGEETKMCLSMPTGVLTLLRAAVAVCQNRELKGRSPDTSISSSPPAGLTAASPTWSALTLVRSGRALQLTFTQEQSHPCFLKVS